MSLKTTLTIGIFCSAFAGGCSHVESRAPSSTAGLEKAAAYFNQGAKGGVEENDVKIKDGRIVSVSAGSKNVSGHFMEDCRKVAIREAILDATSDGYFVESLSRSGSHRLDFMAEDTRYKDDHVGAMVGLNLKRNGEASSLTYSYDLEDDSSGNCYWRSNVSIDVGLQNRRDVEKMMFEKVWPKLSDAKKQEIRNWGKTKKAKNDEEVVAKTVGKLIEWECEQTSLTGATKAAQEFFIAKYKTNPIVHIDFLNSSAQSNIGEGSRNPKKSGGGLDHLEGKWAFRMADAAGANFASVKVGFALKESADGICAGNVSTTAEPF